MTPREAFRAGFLSRCLELGCSPGDVAQLVDKAANITTEAATVATKVAAEKAAITVGDAALAGLGMAAVPVAIGALGGHLLAKSQNGTMNPEAVKREELLRELRRLTREARDAARQQAVRNT